MDPARSRRERLVQHVESKPPSLWRAIWAIVVVTVVFVVVGAVAMRLAEPDEFTNMGDALWFSVETVSTVGYGDFVPESGFGRLVASVIMIFGIALVPAVTAIVITTMMARQQAERAARALEADPGSADLEGQNGEET